MARSSRPEEWVFLTYSLPRTPSAPRLSLWRKLKRLGVVQLADGMVALPADARTREQLEWAAEEATAAGGTAGVWLARAGHRSDDVPPGATPFDMRGVDLGHHGSDCSSETILRRHDLILRALSVAREEDRDLDLTAPIFDAVHDYLRRSRLTRTDTR